MISTPCCSVMKPVSRPLAITSAMASMIPTPSGRSALGDDLLALLREVVVLDDEPVEERLRLVSRAVRPARGRVGAARRRSGRAGSGGRAGRGLVRQAGGVVSGRRGAVRLGRCRVGIARCGVRPRRGGVHAGGELVDHVLARVDDLARHVLHGRHALDGARREADVHSPAAGARVAVEDHRPLAGQELGRKELTPRPPAHLYRHLRHPNPA